MVKLTELLDWLLGDASPEERLRLARITFRIVVGVHILWACGFLAPMGLAGFVFANEVDDKVHAAVEPIRSELGKVSAKVERTEAMARRILQGQLSAQLRDLNRLRCTTTDELTRLRMEQDIEDAAQEYKILTGERYPLSACKDL
jgi:hypothetical protein